MRHFALLITFCFAYGCSDSPNSESAKHISVSVSFKNGFRGDSLILRCDGAVFERLRAFSDSIYVPSGYLFSVNEGMHTFQIEDPQLNVQSDTTFQALSPYRTVIETSFDPREKAFNNSVYYLDTNEILLPHPHPRSLQSVMPR